jgi:hypothetical protein
VREVRASLEIGNRLSTVSRIERRWAPASGESAPANSAEVERGLAHAGKEERSNDPPAGAFAGA